MGFSSPGGSGTLDINGLTADDVALADALPFYDATGSDNNKATIARLLGFANPSLCQGRLTLTSATPVTTADVTAAGTIYFGPFRGNRVSLFDGTRWVRYTLSEVSLALSVATGETYDVFLYDNAGTLTLELSSAWTDFVTRADALALQDGVYCKTGALTRRWVGTIRGSGTDTTEDSDAKRLVWNAQNRVARRVRKIEATASWTYSGSTLRQANASAANQIDLVCGMAGWSLLNLRLDLLAGQSVGGTSALWGIGEDGTTAIAHAGGQGNTNNGDGAHSASLSLIRYPDIGRHYYTWLESSTNNSSAITFYGTLLGATYGLNGTWEC